MLNDTVNDKDKSMEAFMKLIDTSINSPVNKHIDTHIEELKKDIGVAKIDILEEVGKRGREIVKLAKELKDLANEHKDEYERKFENIQDILDRIEKTISNVLEQKVTKIENDLSGIENNLNISFQQTILNHSYLLEVVRQMEQRLLSDKSEKDKALFNYLNLNLTKLASDMQYQKTYNESKFTELNQEIDKISNKNLEKLGYVDIAVQEKIARLETKVIEKQDTVFSVFDTYINSDYELQISQHTSHEEKLRFIQHQIDEKVLELKGCDTQISTKLERHKKFYFGIILLSVINLILLSILIYSYSLNI